MSTAANSSSATVQPQNSPRSRQPRKSSAARGASSPSDISLSMSGILDQEQFFTSSSTTASDLAVKEANAAMSASSSLGEDTLADVQHDNSEENGGAAKKPVWSKPSNGPAAEVVGAVMGAESWPALSESARASPKSPSIYPNKALPLGPLTVAQDLALVSLSSSPKEVAVGASSISAPTTPNHTIPSRQRSMKRGGGSSSSSHSSTLVNDSSLAQASVDASTPHAAKSSGSGGESFRDRDNTNKDGGQRGGTHGGNDSHAQRTSFRRSNSGPLAYQSNHGRRDHERGNQGNRSFGRDNHGPQQRVGSRPFMRGPTPIPPPPPLVRPIIGPVVYTEMASPPVYYVSSHPDQLRPMMVPIPQMYFSMADPHLQSKIMNQIDYYFSNENLVKDTFLRQNMDAEGWVPIKLIAGFKKVMQLTDNIQLILDAVKASNVVEMQGDKMRRKNDWMKWIMPSLQTTPTSPQFISGPSAAQVNNVALNEKAAT